MLRRFEEKDPSFNAMSRSKLEKLESKARQSPAIGTYNPNHDFIEKKVFSPIISLVKLPRTDSKTFSFN